ncbi:MAG: HAD family phosphatase [Candidatus Pacearchaeota archaeon]|nr:MAG: HAD family phosphatase [Candidatus Pacearchaeota archaeon]
MEKIKAIIFDIGGVLTKYKDFHTYMARKFNLKRATWKKRIEPERNLLIRGKISQKIALKKTAKKLNIDEKRIEKILFEGYKAVHKKNPIMINLVKKLKKNYKIIILSNQTLISDRVIKRFNFYKIFNLVILSYKVGTRKPDAKIYKITLKKLKLNPQECIFIDDVRRNILPAKKLKIKTILFKNIRQFKKDLKKFNIGI